MRVAIGSDHTGYEMKDYLADVMRKRGIEVADLGGYAPEAIDYPVAGERVANGVAAGEYDLGVVICGTGVGISIAANKVPGIRCVVCSEPYSAVMARRHNNANVLSLGARVLGVELAAMILEQWIDAEIEGGRHARRVELIAQIEKKRMG
jgi:ribose 5-phosphate isomerase B